MTGYKLILYVYKSIFLAKLYIRVQLYYVRFVAIFV